MTRWTMEDIVAAKQRIGERIAHPLVPTPKPKASKYRNRLVRYQGMTFDSLSELEDWKAFKLQELAGAIRAVARQVSIPLPACSRRIRIDFMVIENDGRIRFFDRKGFETQTGKLKRDQIKAAYGIDIHLIQETT